MNSKFLAERYYEFWKYVVERQEYGIKGLFLKNLFHGRKILYFRNFIFATIIES
jgi:hypothetical protein